MQRLTTMLLDAIHGRRSKLVVFDITSLAVTDTAVVGVLEEMIRAVRLLGAEAMVSGISPSLAQNLTMQGVRLSGIHTTGTLSQAMRDVWAGRQDRQQ